MHSPHFTHAARNFGSGSAPGGRISFGEVLFADSEIRKSGTIDRPSTVEKIHLRRGKSMGFVSARDASIGNVMASAGHWEAQE
jgi:hypothetical protein